MNWKTALFKPKWQHKNPEIRRQAVAASMEADLFEALPDIAATDESAEVRAAAAKRLEQPLLVHSLLDNEKDPAVKSVLSARLQQLLTGPASAGTPLEDQVEAVKRSQERTLLEAVASADTSSALRRAALEKLDRPGFLGDRAIQDPDPELRRLAASRISQHSTLKRVIDAVRTTDKQLHHDLIQRLHQERLEQGDPDALQDEARAICEALENHLRHGVQPEPDVIEGLEARWQKLGRQAPPELARRFRADIDRLRTPAVPRAGTGEKNDPEAPVPPAEAAKPAPQPAIGPEPQEDAAPDPRLVEAMATLDSMAARKRPPSPRYIEKAAANWERAWAAVEKPGPADRALNGHAVEILKKQRERALQAEEKKAQLLESVRERLAGMQRALDDGELQSALEQRAALQELGRQLKGAREWKELQSRLQGTLGRLRELRDWRHWANDKIRKRLIEEMEALPGAGLHPDALLDRVKALQSEWKALEISEQIPGDRHYAAAPWMWRKFQAAGNRAFELTKPFLDKRSEVRSKHLDEIEDTVRQLDAVCEAQPVDWKALGKGIAEARKALRSLSSVPAAARQKMARRLKESLGKANDVKQAHYAEIEKQKLKLIREAAQLQHMSDRDEAIAEAKALQAQWKAAGSLWRSRENDLWQQFREPIEPLFAELENEREAVRAEQEERRAVQQDLCRQMEQICAADEEELADLQGRAQGLEDEWRNIPHADKRLKQRFDRAMAEFRKRERRQEESAARLERARWWAKAELLHDAESALRADKLTAGKRKKLETAWQETGAGESEIDERLDRRFQDVLQENPPMDESSREERIDAARKTCICLEFLAGLPSPEADKDLRMQYQVERLSASMTGDRERIPAQEEARELERSWLLHLHIPDDLYPEFQQRVKAALDKVLEE